VCDQPRKVARIRQAPIFLDALEPARQYPRFSNCCAATQWANFTKMRLYSADTKTFATRALTSCSLPTLRP
jgi:hypothetical protein